MANSTDQWYFSKNGQQGPVPLSTLRQMLTTGQLLPTDLVWQQGMPQWTPAQTIIQAPSLSTLPLPPTMPQPAVPFGLPYASPQSAPNTIGQDAGMRWLLPVGRSGWAIAAGYLGLFSFILLPAPISLIISIIAIIDIKRHPSRHGMGRAIFGLIMGILGTLLLFIMMLALLLTAARPHAASPIRTPAIHQSP